MQVNNADIQFKGIHIKTEDSRKIIVYGQHVSNDAFLALPVIALPPGRTHEYIVASAESLTSNSTVLIVGTENNTNLM